jgi:hypothetical protein
VLKLPPPVVILSLFSGTGWESVPPECAPENPEIPEFLGLPGGVLRRDGDLDLGDGTPETPAEVSSGILREFSESASMKTLTSGVCLFFRVLCLGLVWREAGA